MKNISCFNVLEKSLIDFKELEHFINDLTVVVNGDVSCLYM